MLRRIGQEQILDSTEITDYPVRAVEQAVTFVLRHTSCSVEIEGLRGHAVHDPMGAECDHGRN